MYLFDTSTEHSKLIFGVSDSSDATNVQVFCHIDNGSFDEAAVTIVDPMGHAPEIFYQRRYAPNAATSGHWRHFTSAIENAEGRKPVFKISRQYRDASTTYDLAQWRGVQTTDFVTWTQSDTPTLVGGTSGTFDFQFAAALPAGRSYIAHNVYGRQEEAEALAQWLLVDNAAIAAPADPAYTGGVYANSTVENGDLGQAVGGHPRYAIKLDFGGSTTDGQRKRKMVAMYGIHAAGEAQSWWAFSEAVKWLITSADTSAANLRANWDVYLYFNVNPNGIEGGCSRTTPRNTNDPNRNWSILSSTSSLEEIQTLKHVISNDVSGSCDAFFSFHGDVYATNNFLTWLRPLDYDPATRRPAIQAILTAGETIWGHAPTLSLTDTDNTDLWFGSEVLSAKVFINVEMPSMAGSTETYFGEIGQNWFKSLEVVDQDGGVLATEHNLTGANSTQADASSTAAITQAHALTGPASTQSNLAGTGAVTLGVAVNLTAAASTQGNVASAAGITQAHVLVHAPSVQDNVAAASAIVQIHILAAASSTQGNISSGAEISLAGSPILSTVEVTAIFRRTVARSTKFQRSKSVSVKFN
ncbi:hypothetical protein SAMN05216420_101395 [Nitrosospira sp. Nl5]|uniref:hypothetical protein n=1 Tax=Nitrosospira sp. Nl5 TaxID=200120 RepID=UPI000883F381|nr:hypothetical protein [Nitrosospira sp. Nl5]SCX94064.1 hypothetical protein SAMN05216420_101395 [Nitrosospira sp. Nl5]